MANHRRRPGGFTLVELMITVVIVSILAAIAVPSYLSSIRKSRRTEARTALLDLAGREERFRATQNSYSNTATDLGYGSWPAATVSDYYTLSVAPPQAASGTQAAYFIATATPVAGQGQDQDLPCRKFQIDSTGAQTSYDNNNNLTSTTCWK